LIVATNDVVPLIAEDSPRLEGRPIIGMHEVKQVD
jgi:hypothetical protein